MAAYNGERYGGSVVRGTIARRHRPAGGYAPYLVAGTTAVYVAGFSLLRQQWASLLIFVPVLAGAAALNRLRAFVVTWLPLAVFLDVFARLRGIADDTPIPTHSTSLIAAERWLFGGVPTVWMQQRLMDPERFRWYDYAATFVHWSHFVVPITVLAALWLRFPALFRRYLIAFISLTLLVLGIYFLFPAAPPWLAARNGDLPYVARPMVGIGAEINRTLFGALYMTIGATNDVAAMPSLHAAYPCLMCLMLWPVSRTWGVVSLVYFVVMACALVYLGEHYVVDIVASALCACLARAVAHAVDRRFSPAPNRRPLREPGDSTPAGAAAAGVPVRAA